MSMRAASALYALEMALREFMWKISNEIEAYRHRGARSKTGRLFMHIVTIVQVYRGYNGVNEKSQR